ncbi:helix-turn-helix domain-containing protein [Archaeoglobus profundus]|uniref:Transcriptional regulator, ArsR family n=1 Tax=Archaeoglobus profundus (strain DSM 5631 / JCM 9629 / NBRC 100127 / Av18) TaxID=572546 RepID=D2RE71_ARCPA|nr:ArsR family transcriptional regulator [Archaeoglobus profundus]ADB58415.1 transcriptional regulator, ArsR family [Archaeoglobus profundus DSM 5631]
MLAGVMAKSVVNDKQQKLLKVVSRNGVSSILFSLEKNPMRFSQLMFKTKLNPGILDRHLKALMQLNVVEKNEDKYTLTETGRRLVSILAVKYC